MTATHEPQSYFSMPGAFHSEGVHPGLIRPPESPAVTPSSNIFSSAVLNPEPPSTPSALPRPTYKRRRPELSSSNTNISNTPGKGVSGAPGTSQVRGRNGQHVTSGQHGLATGRSYVLAGNLDTPGAASGGPVTTDALADQGVMGESMFSDSDYRTVLGSKRRREDPETDPTAPPTLYKLPTQPSPKTAGWGAFTFTTLGGVVSKVWDFCWGSTFRGFHAGAGRGYDLQADMQDEDDESTTLGLPGAWDSRDDEQPARRSHLQGAFQSEGDATGQHDTYDPTASESRASTPTRQPAKRRRMDKSDELGRNWVVINQHDAPRSSTPSSRPRVPSSTVSSRNRNSIATPSKGRRVTSGAGSRLTAESGRQTPLKGTPGRRPSSRTSSALGVRTSTWEKPAAASTASFASPRSSPSEPQREFAPRHNRGTNSFSRRSSVVASIDTTTAGADAHSSKNPPSRPGHRRTHSNASAASPRSPHGEPAASLHRRQTSAREMTSGGVGTEGDDNMRKQSPRLNDEARRLAAKRKMEERDADVRIAAFNRRLQDMIRQGKEALGTTVDVEMEGPGEGAWEDDE